MPKPKGYPTRRSDESDEEFAGRVADFKATRPDLYGGDSTEEAGEVSGSVPEAPESPSEGQEGAVSKPYTPETVSLSASVSEVAAGESVSVPDSATETPQEVPDDMLPGEDAYAYMIRKSDETLRASQAEAEALAMREAEAREKAAQAAQEALKARETQRLVESGGSAEVAVQEKVVLPVPDAVDAPELPLPALPIPAGIARRWPEFVEEFLLLSKSSPFLTIGGARDFHALLGALEKVAAGEAILIPAQE